MKLDEGRLGVMGFNNMIPVLESCLIRFDIQEVKDTKYKIDVLLGDGTQEHLRRHRGPHGGAGPCADQPAAQCSRQARAAHRVHPGGAAGERRLHHRCRAGQLVVQQQLHPGCH